MFLMSFQCFGKLFTSKSNNRSRKAYLCGDKCKEAKAFFVELNVFKT